MENKKSGKKAIGMAMAAIMVASILATFAPAFGYFRPVPVPPSEEGIYYLSPKDSNASAFNAVTTVEVHVNSTVIGMRSGSFNLTYDSTCVDIDCADWVRNTTFWDGGTCSKPTTDSIYITWTNMTAGWSGVAPGDYHIGDLTLRCNSTTSCCGCNLSFVPETYIANATSYDIPGENGTFICGEPLVVNKTVWNGTAWVNYLGPLDSSWKGRDVRFNITVKSKCLNLSNVVVNDTLDTRLEYNNSATLGEDSNTTHKANWTLGSIAAGNSKSIEFNATIVAFGVSTNTAKAKATVTDLGVSVEAQDSARVETTPPAGIKVDKTVWNGTAWVEEIQDAHIGETYRFRCEIENTGATGMNVENITVWDVLSDSLKYADSATLTDHHGITKPINPPDEYNDTYARWEINNWTQSPEVLQPGQSIVIEFNATVVNYGYDCNTQYAMAYCAHPSVQKWVTDNDTACINTPMPDLNVSDITVNPDHKKVRDYAVGPVPHPGNLTQCNNISANITERNGVDVEFDFNVTFEVNGVPLNCSPVLVKANELKAGQTITKWCNCSFYPIEGVKYNISVTADADNSIRESNESNNRSWWNGKNNNTAIWVGNKGNHYQDGRNVSALQCHEQGTINLTYSIGDSSKQAIKGGETYRANWTASDLSIPSENTCIKKARLYVYYYYTDANYETPIPSNLSLKFNGYLISPDRLPNIEYTDIPSPWITKYYQYGMIPYNVTHKLKVGENNAAELTNLFPAGTNKVTVIGMLLVVVYNHPDEPERIIWINEGFDRIVASTTGAKYDYGVSSEEAITYAPFTPFAGDGCDEIPLSKIGKATLITITNHAGDKPGDDTNRLYFNGQLLGDGAWYPYEGSTEIGINETEVLSLLKATNNTAAFQSHIPAGGTDGDGFEATNAFLVLEKNPKHIRVMPENLTVQPQEEFTVDIIVNTSGHDVYGVQYKLYYNNSVLRAEMQNKGDFLGQPGETLVIKNEIHHNEGYVEYAETMKGDGCTIGNGTLATIEFIAIGERGAMSGLNFSDVMFVDCNKSENIHFVAHNGTVIINKNRPPVVIATSKHRTNHVAKKYPCITKLCACKSYDPDAPGKGGNISYVRWAFGDGQYGTSEGTFEENCQKEHEYTSYNWEPIGDPNGHYVPMNVILTLTDDGCPPLTNSSDVDVNVYIAGDANGDGEVNILDAVWIGIHWEESCADLPSYPPAKCCYYWTEERTQQDGADLNNDCEVNILDAVIVGANWEHTAW